MAREGLRGGVELCRGVWARGGHTAGPWSLPNPTSLQAWGTLATFS